MIRFLTLLVAVELFWGLCSCHTPPSIYNDSGPTTTATDNSTLEVHTIAEVQVRISEYVQKQPQAALYQLDSMRVLDVGTHWQVLVPRTDWVERMPNAAVFEVDKKDGRVTTRPIK